MPEADPILEQLKELRLSLAFGLGDIRGELRSLVRIATGQAEEIDNLRERIVLIESHTETPHPTNRKAKARGAVALAGLSVPLAAGVTALVQNCEHQQQAKAEAPIASQEQNDDRRASRRERQNERKKEADLAGPGHAGSGSGSKASE